MGLYVIVLWLMLQAECPAWVYVLFGISVFTYMIRFGHRINIEERIDQLEEDITAHK